MNLGLAGKAVVVTGASRGIGLAVARALVAEGAVVVAGARESSAELAELAARAEVAVVLGDLTSAAGCEALVSEAEGRFGGVDVLVTNVGGVRPRTDGFGAVRDDDWRQSWEVNLLSAVRAIRAALPSLVRRAPSTIVTVCSVNATLPDPAVIDYGAAKAGLLSLCTGLSKEVGPRGVRVNTVSPGPVETALWLGAGGVADTLSRATGAEPDAVRAAAVAGTPTERFTHPDEVAAVVTFLASPVAGNITGTDVRIDGGLVTTI